jgi:hypothetical protein
VACNTLPYKIAAALDAHLHRKMRRRSSSGRRAEVHLLEAPQDGFCKRFRCLDRRVVADARKVFEFEVCKELVEAVRPVLRKDWVAFLP